MSNPGSGVPPNAAAIEPVWLVEAGAFSDVSASIVILRAADEQAALDLCSDDVYLRNGIWVELRARAFGRVTGG